MFLSGKLTQLSTQSPQSRKHYCTLVPTETLAIAMMKGNGHSSAGVIELLTICTNGGKSLQDRGGKRLAGL